MKFYCRPAHIISLNLEYFVLDGIELSIRRLYLSTNMISVQQTFNPLDGYKEVTPEGFTTLVEKHASKESIDKFKEEYDKLYKFYQ